MKKIFLVPVIVVLFFGIVFLVAEITPRQSELKEQILDIPSDEEIIEIPSDEEIITPTTKSVNNCDPSYPDVCIAPYPPDLNCSDISYGKFRVIGEDPHGFDRDNDGIGCKSN